MNAKQMLSLVWLAVISVVYLYLTWLGKCCDIIGLAVFALIFLGSGVMAGVVFKGG
jgi:hypothetical protein